MKLKDDVLFLGLGNCGCKIAKEFVNIGYKAMFANGSEQDLKLLGGLQNIYRLKNYDGFGGHRVKAIDCLQENEEFLEALQNIKEKIIFVAYGGGGSTGSGLSSIIEELLLEAVNENDTPVKIVCPISALPSTNEAIAKHKNAYQAIVEQQELIGLGASFFINNNSSSDYKWINTTFAKMLNAFLSDNSYGEANNFDISERIEMLREYGAMVLTLAGKDSRETMLDKLVRTGIFASIQNDKLCGQIGIIHAGKIADDIQADTIIAECGKPLNVFEGFNGGGTLIAVSGLTYPVDYLNKIGELARQAQQERVRSRESSVRKLSALEFEEEKKPENPNTLKKQPSKLQLLREKKAKKNLA